MHATVYPLAGGLRYTTPLSTARSVVVHEPFLHCFLLRKTKNEVRTGQ